MRIPVVIVALAALAVSGPTWAQTAADAPVATASRTSSSPTTQQQIDDYLATSPATVDGEIPGVTVEDGLRGIHGEVSVSVGTGGYRSGYLALDVPIGERGNLALSYGQTDHGDSGYGYGYGYPDQDHAPMTFDAWSDSGSRDLTSCSPGFRDGAGASATARLDRMRGASSRCISR